MSNLSVFNFESHTIRSVMIEGEPWFVAADVCSALEHSNPSKAVSDHVHEEDKGNYSLGLPGSAPTVGNCSFEMTGQSS